MEGLSDDHPIPLSDSAEHFRDLMWALYAAYATSILRLHPKGLIDFTGHHNSIQRKETNKLRLPSNV